MVGAGAQVKTINPAKVRNVGNIMDTLTNGIMEDGVMLKPLLVSTQANIHLRI